MYSIFCDLPKGPLVGRLWHFKGNKDNIVLKAHYIQYYNIQYYNIQYYNFFDKIFTDSASAYKTGTFLNLYSSIIFEKNFTDSASAYKSDIF